MKKLGGKHHGPLKTKSPRQDGSDQEPLRGRRSHPPISEIIHTGFIQRLLRPLDHAMQTTTAKRKAVLERIESLEKAIAKAREYLASGEHANWSGFRPMFVTKFRDGLELPPHKDWVRHVFLPRTEKALRHAETVLHRFTERCKPSR